MLMLLDVLQGTSVMDSGIEIDGSPDVAKHRPDELEHFSPRKRLCTSSHLEGARPDTAG